MTSSIGNGTIAPHDSTPTATARRLEIKNCLSEFCILLSKNGVFSITIVVCLLLGNTASAQQPVLRSTTDYPVGGVSLGYGWNSTYDQKTIGLCVVFIEKSDPGQDATASISNVSDKSSLMSSLQISVGAQVKAVVASGSGATDFAKSVQLNNNRTNFSVHALVKNGAKYAGPSPNGMLDLAPTFVSLARTDPLKFYNSCGDSFVSALYGGAELNALVSLEGMDIQQEQNFKTSVQGSYAVFSGSGNVATNVKYANDHNLLSIYYRQSGGAGQPLATDQAGIIRLMEGLATAAQSAPVTFQIELTRYESLPSWQGIPRPVSAVAVDRIARRYGQFVSLRDDMEAILANPQPYILDRGVTIKNLKDMDDEVLHHIQNLSTDAHTCEVSLGQHCSIDAVDDISDYSYRIRMPILKRAFGIDDQIALRNQWNDMSHSQLRINGAKNGPLYRKILNDSIQQNLDQIAEFQKNYPSLLKQSIGIKWISSVVNERCRQDPNSSDCLTNAQADAWIAQIPTK